MRQQCTKPCTVSQKKKKKKICRKLCRHQSAAANRSENVRAHASLLGIEEIAESAVDDEEEAELV